MAKSQITLADVLHGVEWRLEEALQAFEAHRILHERCNSEAAPELNKAINDCAGFWQPVNIGLQSTLVIGIAALIDKERRDCSTLYKAIDLLTSDQRSKLPVDFIDALDEIRGRYVKFRHKLFAHNDLNRGDVVIDMQNAGFTWDSVDADLLRLRRSLKFLRHLCAGKPPMNWGDLDSQIRLNELAILRTRRDTGAFLDLLHLAIRLKASTAGETSQVTPSK
ncbi:MAG: hypothetical protein Q8L49_00370 [Burkholderiaceae bacterium]|nr:hypothetical protein [Burkholderiaceae bacterium]